MPPLIYHVVELGSARLGLGRLEFPLGLPDVPGYEVGDAYPDGGWLQVEMIRQGTPPDRQARIDGRAISVRIAAASDDYMLGTLATAMEEGQPAGPDQWVLPTYMLDDPHSAIARHGDVLMEASVIGPDYIPLAALLTATAGLHPVSVATIMSGGKLTRSRPSSTETDADA